MNRYKAQKGLQVIPGVGPVIARELVDLGYRTVSDLKNKNAESMYQGLCELRDRRVDRCVLYVFRCAVYYAGTAVHDPELLKWWNWRDKK